jgi:hypothetical protein
MFSGRHELVKDDRDGSYFIDRDPTYFGLILNYLRDPELLNYELMEDCVKVSLLKESRYYCLCDLESRLLQQREQLLLFEIPMRPVQIPPRKPDPYPILLSKLTKNSAMFADTLSIENRHQLVRDPSDGSYLLCNWQSQFTSGASDFESLLKLLDGKLHPVPTNTRSLMDLLDKFQVSHYPNSITLRETPQMNVNVAQR